MPDIFSCLSAPGVFHHDFEFFLPHVSFKRSPISRPGAFISKFTSKASFCKGFISIPKILRRYFLYDRKLLSELSRFAWETLKVFFQETVSEDGAVPEAAVAIQSFGDFLGFNPHLHILGTDGCFYGNGMFRVAPHFETKHLEKIFRHKVLKMLLSRGKITQDLVSMLLSWRHSGFNVFCGPSIQPGYQQAMENLARYIMGDARSGIALLTLGHIIRSLDATIFKTRRTRCPAPCNGQRNRKKRDIH